MDTFTNDDKKIKKVFFCSGAIYLRLHQLISASKDHENIAIVRIEELAPFPVNEVSDALKSLHFTKNTEIHYIQEEHMNFGAFSWWKMYLANIMKRLGHDKHHIKYIGRGPEATIATASSKDFKDTENAILNEFKRLSGIKS